MERSRVRRSAGIVAAVSLLVVAGLVWWRWPDAPAPVVGAPPAAPSSAPAAVHGPCSRSAARPFVPTSIRVAGTVQAVYAVPRTADGVMGVLAHTDKTDFATDQGGVEAGALHGRVLLNTHTWPDGTAMGNRLLAHLHVGDRIVLRGHRQVACYRVTSREQVLASNGYPGWDRTNGRPQAVIVVCSGTRLGPGDWTHRTLWFADRYFGGSEPA
ncbi:MAG TPA: class F sortase [Nocardioides sp.]|nr:class F sortase [Nocardioides sp.]